MSTATWIGAALLALVLVLLLREVVAVYLARAPRDVRLQRVGPPAGATAAAGAGDAIPRVLWTYWHGTPPSPFVQQCIGNWQRMAPDHTVRQLDPQSMLQWIPADQVRADFHDLPPYRQADWLRIQLLARHGGVWIDASTLLSRDLGWVHETREAQGVDYVGFYIDRYTQRPDQPLVENWFMASPAGAPFVVALAREFDRALDIGAEAYLDELRASGRHARVVQGLDDEGQRYLLMHVCASNLLDQAPVAYRLALRRAEDTAFAFHTALGWRKRHLFARLAITPAPRHLPLLIKLRGGDRQVVEQHLAQGHWIRSSIAARLLALR